ncbi:hypothetical protein LWE61_14930 [Sphingobium sufflavum]|uniref:hypothetical protein n=1 Tax=Sphingobium sufflavum TaxID=1129547 RepID=UPI001F331D75|nr:hypothetical protein [Sphingobium sufflavum]MCE7797844.1 hypothetical protein [Sphingobium sufflavum]
MMPSPVLGRAALGIAITGAILTAVLVWFARHDAAVIRDHDARQAADTAVRTLGAERAANINSAARQDVARRNEEDLHDAQQSAQSHDPVGAARPVGPATGAVVDELRRQRAAQPAR